jgi:hypothetical protein
MRVRLRCFHAVKGGNAPHDYEDAYWPRDNVEQRTSAFRLAVADGATEASFSEQWARLLVRAYCRGQLEGARLPPSLAQLRALWQEAVCSLPLPWYAEEKARGGAFAALAGLTVREHSAGSGTWHASALGDSCVYQVRGHHMLAAFPLSSSASFSSRPCLLASTPASGGEMLATNTGTWKTGDRFFLMSDALAQWFLARVERGGRPWSALAILSRSGEWDNWLRRSRQRGAIRNDDVTLMYLELH